MSGGVDSSAAAALLVQQGYDCDGAMLKLAPNEDSRCCSADDAEDARQAATRLGMRFYVFNETDRFRRCVMDRFTAEYAAGRTPNPCIDCNRELKSGPFVGPTVVCTATAPSLSASLPVCHEVSLQHLEPAVHQPLQGFRCGRTVAEPSARLNQAIDLGDRRRHHRLRPAPFHRRHSR